MAIYELPGRQHSRSRMKTPLLSGRARANATVQSTVILPNSASDTAPVYVPRQDIAALGKLLLVSGLSREFLPAPNENTINGIIQSFVAMSDWPLIEQNFRVDLAGLCGGRPKRSRHRHYQSQGSTTRCAILLYSGSGSFDRPLHRTDRRDKRRSL